MLDPSVRIRPTDLDDAGGAVDVAVFEREQLRGPEPGRGREQDHLSDVAGFGLDSLIEIVASLVVVWQLQAMHAVKRERSALRIIGVAFLP